LQKSSDIFLTSISPEFIVEPLFLLLSVTGVPKWLQGAAGGLLTKCLLKPRGIAVVLDRMLMPKGPDEGKINYTFNLN
jgi:hypothetical protein